MRVVTTAGMVMLLLAREAGGQTPPALGDVTRLVAPGDQLLVLTTEGGEVVGRAETLTTASLGIRTTAGLISVPSARIGRIVVKDSVKNGLWIGTAAGAAAGLVGGLFVNSLCMNESASCPGIVLLFTSMGAGAGAALGAGIDGLRHRTVFDALRGVPGELLPHAAVNFAFSRSTPWGMAAVNGPPSLGASWGMRHSSNFGLEVEANRTVGQATRLLSCTTAPATTAGRQGCVGEGRQGLADTTAVAAKVQYYVSKARVQPYLSGGFGVHQSSVWRTEVAPRFRTPDTFLRQSLSRELGLAWVAGAGARVVLTDRISLRPDLTVYRAAGWSHLRAGVGVSVSW